MMTKIWAVLHYEEIGPYWVVDYVSSSETAEDDARKALAEFKEPDDTIIYWIGELHNA